MAEKLIFFVDDEPMFINLLEYTFKCRNGYTVQTFSNGEDCLAHLSKNPDLVVIDYFLHSNESQMTGLDLVKSIKAAKTNTPVIILSGNDSVQVMHEAKALGVYKYILKDGYFIDNLIESVSQVLPQN